MTVEENIKALDRTGGAVYNDSTDPLPACWFDIAEDRLWYHLGDKPRWGPKIAELTAYGGGLIAYHPDGSLRFFATELRDAFPDPGAKADQIEEQRLIMTRVEAREMLGDAPPEPPTAPTGTAAPPEA